MAHRVWLMTGASRGIGAEIANAPKRILRLATA